MDKCKRRYRSLIWLFCVLTAIACLSFSVTGFAKKSITIGTYPFPEDIAVTHVWKQLLEKKGYDVTIKQASRPIVMAGVAKGSFNFGLELWLPYTDKERYDKFKDQVNLIGPWYDKAWQGLAVPDYMHIKSIAELKDHADSFTKKIIHTAGPGAVVTQNAKKAIKIYHLPFKARVATEPASLADLKAAYATHEPFIITLWHPHWAWAQYKLHMLADPKGAFNPPNHIYAYVHKGFKKEYPDVTRWLGNFHLGSKQLAKLMNKTRKADSPETAAANWIRANKVIWQKWFKSS